MSETRLDTVYFPFLTLHICDPNTPSNRTEIRRWFPFCEDAFAIIFVVDLSSYDQPLTGDPDGNQMMKTLAFFKKIVNLNWAKKASIILFLDKLDVLASRLKSSPIEGHFGEFIGANSSNPAKAAAEYLLAKFNSLNSGKLQVSPHFVPSGDITVMDKVITDIKDMIIVSNARDWQIL